MTKIYTVFVMLFLDSALSTTIEGLMMLGREAWDLVTVSKRLQYTVFTGCYRVPEAIRLLEKLILMLNIPMVVMETF